MSRIDVKVGDKVFWSDLGCEEFSTVQEVSAKQFKMLGPDSAGYLENAWYDRSKLFRSGDKLCANVGG